MELISILNFRSYIELLRKILFWQKTDMTNNMEFQLFWYFQSAVRHKRKRSPCLESVSLIKPLTKP